MVTLHDSPALWEPQSFLLRNSILMVLMLVKVSSLLISLFYKIILLFLPMDFCKLNFCMLTVQNNQSGTVIFIEFKIVNSFA